MQFKPGTLSLIKGQDNLSLLIQYPIALISRDQPRAFGEHAYFKVSSRGSYLTALRSVPSDIKLVIIFIDQLTLKWVSPRATRVAAVMADYPVLIISDGADWPDDIEGRLELRDGLLLNSSLYSKILYH